MFEDFGTFAVGVGNVTSPLSFKPMTKEHGLAQGRRPALANFAALTGTHDQDQIRLHKKGLIQLASLMLAHIQPCGFCELACVGVDSSPCQRS